MNIKKHLLLSGVTLIMSMYQPAIAEDKAGMTMDQSAVTEPHFIEMMTRHHQEGVDMAKLALEKSQNTKVKKMSQKIVAAQTKEIAQFAKWKKQWYLNTSTNMDMEKMNMPMMDMSSLKTKAGKDFDSEYLSMMSMHHEGAIKMAKDATPNLEHKEVKTLADKIIKDQTAEVSQLQEMKKSL